MLFPLISDTHTPSLVPRLTHTMTTTLFAHQNGGCSHVNWINVQTATGL